MADNVTTNAASGGDTIAADDIAGVKYQRIKLIQGADGVNAGDVSSAAPLQVTLANTEANATAVKVDASSVAVPVTDNSGSLTVDQGTATNLKTQAEAYQGGSAVASGNPLEINVRSSTLSLATSTKQSDGTQKTQIVDGSGNVIGATSNALDINIKSGNPTSIGVNGSGATSIAKLEDVAHSSGDMGVPAWGVSNENATAFAAASGDYIPIATNRYGHVYVSALPPSHASSSGTPITATTTTVIAAPSAGNHLRVTRIHMSNGGATATWVGVRDGASGTKHYMTYLPQGGAMSINLKMSGPLDLTTATRLDIFLSAAGSVEYEIDYLTVAD